MSSVTPQIYNDRYELSRLIARGGMAEVFLARDLLLDRPVALKALFPELSVDHSFVERFRREAQAAANLSHPNIVSVYDWGQADHTYFIVMELVDGQPLSAILRSEGPLLADRAAAIGADVALALSFAHSHGVIHRDVKPGNVLITPDGVVKVTDFGIARAANTTESLTQTGAVMGTATYFSPEQAQGLRVDPRSDVYSLGVVLYEAVTGRPPFSGESPVAVAYKHVRENPVPPRQINPNIPAPFEAVLLQAMAKNPDDRYQSAQELRADLLRYQRGRMVLANPITPAQTVQADAHGDRTQAVPVGDRTLAIPPVPPGPEEKDHRTLYWGILLGVLLVALGIVLYLVGRNLGVFGGSASSVTVPSVVGQPVSSATQTLTGDGLSPQVKRANNPAAKNTVFAQNPTANAKVNKGASVEIDVSNGPGTVLVPNVVGKNVNVATAALQAAGLSFTTTSVTDSRQPNGTVLSQQPAAGNQVASGSLVTLSVASQAQPVPVPNVVDQTQSQAVAALNQAGLQLGIETRQSSANVPAGTVISSNPPPGTLVTPGTSVALVVSSGQAQTTVPNVIGFTQSGAQSALSNAGLNVKTVNQVVGNPADYGVVISQAPGPSAQVNPGTTVTITVGTPASTTTSSIP